MKADQRRELFARLAELNPRPTTELEYSTPYELLVAVACVTLALRALGHHGSTQAVMP